MKPASYQILLSRQDAKYIAAVRALAKRVFSAEPELKCESVATHLGDEYTCVVGPDDVICRELLSAVQAVVAQQVQEQFREAKTDPPGSPEEDGRPTILEMPPEKKS